MERTNLEKAKELEKESITKCDNCESFNLVMDGNNYIVCEDCDYIKKSPKFRAKELLKEVENSCDGFCYTKDIFFRNKNKVCPKCQETIKILKGVVNNG